MNALAGEALKHKEGPIDAELNDFARALCALADRTRQLHGSIEPILRSPSPPTPEGIVNGARPVVDVPMVHRIRSMRMDLDAARATVEDALERLAL